MSFTFFRISRKEGDNIQTDLKKEVASNEFDIVTYGGNTEEREEANANLEDKKQEISNKIELRLGFEELGEKLNARELGKFRKALEEANRRE